MRGGRGGERPYRVHAIPRCVPADFPVVPAVQKENLASPGNPRAKWRGGVGGLKREVGRGKREERGEVEGREGERKAGRGRGGEEGGERRDVTSACALVYGWIPLPPIAT